MRAHWKLIAGIVAALALLHVVTGQVSDPPAPGGPRSSSFATGADGVAAYARLLQRAGHPVARARERLDRAALQPDDVLVVLDTPMRPEEAAAVASFVRSGGTVVAGGPEIGRWLAGGLVTRAPDPARGGSDPPVVLAPVAETAGVSRLSLPGPGTRFAFSPATTALPVVGDGSGALVAVADAGRGRVVMVADSSVFWNAELARQDNAAFGLNLVPPGRRVVFAEFGHGYGHAGGISAIPTTFRFVLAGLAAAVLLFGWSRAVRFGPPARRHRALPPPRAAFADALARTLARTEGDPEAIAPLRREARRTLRGRGVADVGDDVLRRAGAARGLTAAELDAILGDGGDDATVMAAGSGAAKLTGSREGER